MAKFSALGLDVGRKRIGVAGCDGTGLIATGLLTIEYKSLQQVVGILQQLSAEREVQVLVIGKAAAIILQQWLDQRRQDIERQQNAATKRLETSTPEHQIEA